MKKLIVLFFVCLVCAALVAEDYPFVKLLELENSSEEGKLYIKKQDPEEDKVSGSGIKFDSLGNAYMIQSDTDSMYTFDISNGNTVFLHDLKFLEWEGFNSATENSYFFSGGYGRAKLVDKNFNMVFKVRMLDWPMRLDTVNAYYDEQCDVLFFRDDNSNLYSIEHPSMDEAENKANFKGPTETIEMLNSGKYAPHLTTKNNSLWIDGLSYYWPGKKINKICYQYVDESSITIFVPDNTVRFDFRSPDEQIESIEIHPCGDIYVLRMNWNTNTHILYRVKNTWDPEWRASWYAEHPDAPGKELPSGNGSQAAATTVRTGYLNDDRIRLRKGPGTGTNSLGTYPINTTFTILENSGVKQTIDGVTSEWIKVRLSDGTEGYFYGQYVSEK